MTQPKSKKRKKYSTLAQLIPDCENSVVFDAESITPTVRLAGPDAKLAVVFGDNATGKSLMLMVLRAFLGKRDESGAEIFSVSMRARTAGGLGGMFMYLDESYNSTGVSSLNSVLGSFHNAKARPHPVWLMFDEPDVGLSDKYASAMGAYIAQEVNACQENIKGVVVVTHSRPLLRRLLADLQRAPHEIGMGTSETLAHYLDPDNQAEASIEELMQLMERGSVALKQVAAILR